MAALESLVHGREFSAFAALAGADRRMLTAKSRLGSKFSAEK
jgi:hypothetical protein